MTFVDVSPNLLAGAAESLARVGSALDRAHALASPATTTVAAAAADEVSVAIATLFGGFGREFQALGAQCAAFHGQFALALGAGGSAYAAAEASNVMPLKTLISDAQQYPWLSPWQGLTGRPLFGVGTNGAAGTGRPEAPGAGSSGSAVPARQAWRALPTTRAAAPAAPAARVGRSGTVGAAGQAGQATRARSAVTVEPVATAVAGVWCSGSAGPAGPGARAEPA